MTTYFVRKTGNDTNDGLSSGAAFLTVDKAANTVAAGDIVYIGAGVYRESVTIDTSGTDGSEIEWRADIDGAQTGDKGLVIITVLSDETGTAGTGHVCDLNGKDWNEFYNIIFGPGGTDITDNTIAAKTGNAVYQGVLFDSCVFLNTIQTSRNSISINYNNGGAITGTQLTFINCVINGGIYLSYATFSADSACGFKVENCIFNGLNYFSVGVSVTIDGPSSGSYGPTGFTFINNTFLHGYGYSIEIMDQWATGEIGTFYNNLFITQHPNAMSFQADSGDWSGDFNITTAELLTIDTSGNYTDGANDDNKRSVILGAWIDPMLQKAYGSTPYHPYEQVWDHLGGGYKSGGIDVGGAAYAPATDLYGNPRPMGRTNDDAGAVESRRRIAQETTTVRTGANAGVFEGAGYHDIILPVEASSTTVTVYGRYDSNYTGDKPLIEVFNIPGVADQSDAMTGAADTWEAIACTFTPSAAGVVRVRLRSRDTSANGKAFFDDLVVT